MYEIIYAIYPRYGCNTSSTLFQKRKLSSVQLLQKNPNLMKIVEVSNHPEAMHEEIFSNVCKFLLALYSSSYDTSITLNEYRFQFFDKHTICCELNLDVLLPSEDAVCQHLCIKHT